MGLGHRGAIVVMVLLIGGILASEAVAAQSDPVWTHQFGQEGYDSARAVAVDGAGDVYVTGWVDGVLPGETSSGAADSFVRAYGSDGQELWSHQFGTEGDDFANGIAAADSGLIYVVGVTSGSFPGHESAGSYDSFVLAFGSDGEQLWAQQFGTEVEDVAYGAAVDRSGTVHIAGATLGALEGQTSSGSADAFIQSYDRDGQVTRTIQFGTVDDDSANDIAIHDEGDVYVAGVTTGTFGEAWGDGGSDAFVRVYDPAGNELWTGQLERDEAIGAEAVAVGRTAEAYLAVSPSGDSGGDSFGSFAAEVWSRGNASASHVVGDGSLGIAVDRDGNIYLAGYTRSALEGQVSAGLADAFVRVWDADWDVIEDVQFGSEEGDAAYGVAVDHSGNVYVVGEAYGALPGQVAAGDADAFVTKYSSLTGASLPAVAAPEPPPPAVDLVRIYPRDLGAGSILEDDLTVRRGEEIAETITGHFAEMTGRPPEDVTMISGTHPLPDPGVLIALQVGGADPEILEEAFVDWYEGIMGFTGHHEAQVAEKDVTIFESDEELPGYVDAAYVSGDIVWVWSGGSGSFSEIVLQALPD